MSYLKHAKIKMSHHTPLEIQLEIMKRVPVKSVIRFRSVSKQWKSLIDTSKFIADHTVRDTHRQPLLLIRYKDLEESKQCFMSIVDNDRFPEQKLSLINVPESVNIINDPIILGGSHGLLCFYDSPPISLTETLVLWNPSIRKSVTIDVPNVLFDSLYGTSVGFGVCPNTCDPKIVKINYISTLSEIGSVSCIPWQVQVFTLSSRAWRSPRTNVPRKSIGFTLSQVAIDEFIYWLGYDSITTDAGVRSHNLIVSFDLTSDEFKELCLPRSLAFQDQHLLYISKLKESLVVLEYCKDALQPLCVVWKMERHGVPKSFTKMFTVKAPDTSLLNFVLGFRKNGQPIMETVPHSEVSSSLELDEEEVSTSLEVYEPSSKRINDLGIYGVDGSFALRSYTETLLLLDQSELNDGGEDR